MYAFSEQSECESASPHNLGVRHKAYFEDGGGSRQHPPSHPLGAYQDLTDRRTSQTASDVSWHWHWHMAAKWTAGFHDPRERKVAVPLIVDKPIAGTNSAERALYGEVVTCLVQVANAT